MYTCNCFVLAHGEYTEDKKFKVNVLGMPPPENRVKSLYELLITNSIRSAYGNDVDFFGGPSGINDMVWMNSAN